jgi:hypothetical protein
MQFVREFPIENVISGQTLFDCVVSSVRGAPLMIKSSRFVFSAGLATVIPVFFLLYSTAAFAESLSLNQCANGGISDAVNHLECHEGWINGNLNASKAAFAEGDFVPYRVQMTGLTPGEQYIRSRQRMPVMEQPGPVRGQALSSIFRLIRRSDLHQSWVNSAYSGARWILWVLTLHSPKMFGPYP